MKKIKQEGFTLIELLVVIVIIGLLTSLSLYSFQNAKKQARDTKRKSDLETIRSALELSKSDCDVYPEDILSGVKCVTSMGTNTYLNAPLPSDPSEPQRNYAFFLEDNSYVLCAGLESLALTDSVCSDAGLNCGAGVPCNYHVINP